MLIPEKQPYNQYKTVACPWIADILQEKFDDAMSLADDRCMIYGGAIRDILADMPIRGDLDIAVPRKIFTTISGKFNNSTRWISKSLPLRSSNSAHPTTAKKVISSVRTFNNINGDVVQVIAPELNRDDTIQGINVGVMDIVLNVDIVCCGVMSDVFGTVYEVIPGAIRDCKNRVLRFNRNIKATQTSIDRLKQRVVKFKARGWESEIDFSKINIIKEPTPFSKLGGNPTNVFGKF